MVVCHVLCYCDHCHPHGMSRRHVLESEGIHQDHCDMRSRTVWHKEWILDVAATCRARKQTSKPRICWAPNARIASPEQGCNNSCCGYVLLMRNLAHQAFPFEKPKISKSLSTDQVWVGSSKLLMIFLGSVQPEKRETNKEYLSRIANYTRALAGLGNGYCHSRVGREVLAFAAGRLGILSLPCRLPLKSIELFYSLKLKWLSPKFLILCQLSCPMMPLRWWSTMFNA